MLEEPIMPHIENLVQWVLKNGTPHQRNHLYNIARSILTFCVENEEVPEESAP